MQYVYAKIYSDAQMGMGIREQYTAGCNFVYDKLQCILIASMPSCTADNFSASSWLLRSTALKNGKSYLGHFL